MKLPHMEPSSRWALAMGHDEVVGLLEETLAEEKAAEDRFEATDN